MPAEDRFIWLNGEMLHLKDAKINVLSPTAQFGANVFEGIRCYWNDKEKQLYAFRLDKHYKRLRESAKIFRIEIKYSDEELIEYFKDVIKINHYQEDIAVRQTIFIDGFGSWSSLEPVDMFIAPIPKKRNNIKKLSALDCGISSWQRISDYNISPRVKVGANYINSRMAQLEIKENGHDTPIFLNSNGNVSEGPGSCLFIFKDGKLITPSITSSILNSITRETIIQIAQEDLDIEVVERDVNRTELYVADEAFLCGSAMEIRQIGSIDGYILPKEYNFTILLHELYLNIVSGNKIKYKEWLTPVYN